MGKLRACVTIKFPKVIQSSPNRSFVIGPIFSDKFSILSKKLKLFLPNVVITTLYLNLNSKSNQIINKLFKKILKIVLYYNLNLTSENTTLKLNYTTSLLSFLKLIFFFRQP